LKELHSLNEEVTMADGWQFNLSLLKRVKMSLSPPLSCAVCSVQCAVCSDPISSWLCNHVKEKEAILYRWMRAYSIHGDNDGLVEYPTLIN